MVRRIIARAYVSNTHNLEELVRTLPSIEKARAIAAEKQYDLHFGLKITLANACDPDLAQQARIAGASLPPDVWLLYDTVDKGPGTSYRQVLFNPGFTDDLVALCCLDQFVIDTKTALARINKHMDAMSDCLYMTGSRDVPVCLGIHESSSSLRILHELYHSLAMHAPRPHASSLSITPAYAETGESTSGFYVLNRAHPGFRSMALAVEKTAAAVDLSGFAMDYYVAIKSSLLGKVHGGYVRSKRNRYYSDRSETEELQAVTSLIFRQTRALGSTDIAGVLKDAVKDAASVKWLSHFYPLGSVLHVQDIMLSALG